MVSRIQSDNSLPRSQRAAADRRGRLPQRVVRNTEFNLPGGGYAVRVAGPLGSSSRSRHTAPTSHCQPRSLRVLLGSAGCLRAGWDRPQLADAVAPRVVHPAGPAAASVFGGRRRAVQRGRRRGRSAMSPSQSSSMELRRRSSALLPVGSLGRRSTQSTQHLRRPQLQCSQQPQPHSGRCRCRPVGGACEAHFRFQQRGNSSGRQPAGTGSQRCSSRPSRSRPPCLRRARVGVGLLHHRSRRLITGRTDRPSLE